MLEFHSKAFRLLIQDAAFAFVVFIGTLICFSATITLMFELLSVGVNRYASLTLAILAAIGVFCFMRWNHKIWEFIYKQGNENNE